MTILSKKIILKIHVLNLMHFHGKFISFMFVQKEYWEAKVWTAARYFNILLMKQKLCLIWKNITVVIKRKEIQIHIVIKLFMIPIIFIMIIFYIKIISNAFRNTFGLCNIFYLLQVRWWSFIPQWRTCLTLSNTESITLLSSSSAKAILWKKIYLYNK